jgi:NAD(P)-dependent dehydrogenase (short-subunit alcohol dehydrogenase family)
MLKVAIPHLRQSRGRCIFTSSGAATGAYSAWSAYNASKAALNSLCRTVATEEADITFVAVRPGVVDTGMQDLLLERGKEEMSPSD